MIKAINTYYNGNYFRSRLEAHWAVLFDELGLQYIYEPDGFELENGQRYLPDFYLPHLDSYVEIKPSFQFKEGLGFNPHRVSRHEDFETKWKPFSKNYCLIIAIGKPGYAPAWQLRPEFHKYQGETAYMIGVKGFHFYKDQKEVISANSMRFEHVAGEHYQAQEIVNVSHVSVKSSLDLLRAKIKVSDSDELPPF